MTDCTCEPPPEHRDKRFHWLKLHSDRPEPAYWLQGRAWMLFGSSICVTARHMHAAGWRYVAPAISPTQEG